MWENACGYLKKGNLHSIVTSGVGVWGPAMRVGTDCRDLSDHDSFSGMSFEPCLYKSMNQETVQQNGRQKEGVSER